MSRILAIEWDQREARVVLAQARGGEVLIEDALAIELSTREEDRTSVPADFGSRLFSALASRQVGKVETLVAVGRASIELKLLSLPPAPDEELPELVKFQALREFHSLESDWPLDYLPLEGDASRPHKVLAAAISPELVTQIRASGASAQLRPCRLVLRPCAAASLLKRQLPAGEDSVRLVIDLLADEVDLTALARGDVVFTRTVRLRGDLNDTGTQPALLGEIRRTIAAVQNNLGGQRVGQLYLYGDPQQHEELAAYIGRQLGLPTQVVDPFDGLHLSTTLAAAVPAHRGRYAPLLGMLLDEADRTPHAIDFLHPRKAVGRKLNVRTLSLAVTAALVFVLAIAWWIGSSLTALDGQIERLGQESTQLDVLVQRSGKLKKEVAEIEKWAASDVVWLDELYRLNKQFPAGPDGMLLDLRINAGGDGGRMDLEGLVRDAPVIDVVEQNLRDRQHQVIGKGSQQEEDNRRYQWRFKSQVRVEGAPPAPRVNPSAKPKDSGGT